MIGAVAYSVAFAGFLGGCLIAALITEGGDTQQAASLTDRLPCSGNDEIGLAVALGGCATEIPTCGAPRSDWVAGDFEPFHSAMNTRDKQHGRS